MKIALGNDHAGLALKYIIADYIRSMGHEVVDVGCYNEEPVDYPVYAKKAADLVAAKETDCGILICGTGIGIAMAAGKVKGIRVATCSDPVSARLAKEHNNANMISLGARVIGHDTAKAIVKAYLDAEFQGGRHQRRIDMIHEIEQNG